MTAVARIIHVSLLQGLLVLAALVIVGGMIAVFVWTTMGNKDRK